MKLSLSKDIQNNPRTAGCPYCGYQNILSKENLLYFRDTMVVKGTICSRCGEFIQA